MRLSKPSTFLRNQKSKYWQFEELLDDQPTENKSKTTSNQMISPFLVLAMHHFYSFTQTYTEYMLTHIIDPLANITNIYRKTQFLLYFQHMLWPVRCGTILQILFCSTNFWRNHIVGREKQHQDAWHMREYGNWSGKICVCDLCCVGAMVVVIGCTDDVGRCALDLRTRHLKIWFHCMLQHSTEQHRSSI